MGATLQVDISGKDKLIAAFMKMPAMVKSELRKSVLDGLNQTIRTVIKNPQKGYTSRSGNLDKSMYADVSEDGLAGTITLSKTVSNAPYALIQHEGGHINQVTTSRQAFFLSKKFNTWITPGTEINIDIKAKKFLTKVWEMDSTRQKIVDKIYKGIDRAIKKAGF